MAKAQATVSKVAASATVVTLLDAEGQRESLIIFNDSTAILYVKLGDAAAADDFSFSMAAGAYWEPPAQDGIYTGNITGFWAAVNGKARITSISG